MSETFFCDGGSAIWWAMGLQAIWPMEGDLAQGFLKFAAVVGAGLALVFATHGAIAADAPQFSLPITCEPGQTCFIQSYVDLDPGSGAKDFACGTATYDGHNGVDFRLLSAKAAEGHVAVLAAADGVVKGFRDGERDVFASDGGRERIRGRECGNGVVVDHGGGWETQYCHLRQGSVRAAKNQKIKRGEQLGDVGFSGFADFAHVHFSVRFNGKIIDPFAGAQPDAACSRDRTATSGLWAPAVAAAFPYKNGEIITAGFTNKPPMSSLIEKTGEPFEAPEAKSQNLIYAARFINLKRGDRVRITISGPGGFSEESFAEPLDRAKATYLGYTGRRLSAARWEPGRYQGRSEIVRDGAVVEMREGALELP